MNKLRLIRKNLSFGEALEFLKLGGFIKVPEWDGYWFKRGGKIMVKTWDGKELDTPWLEATVLREDWQLVQLDGPSQSDLVNILECNQPKNHI